MPKQQALQKTPDASNGFACRKRKGDISRHEAPHVGEYFWRGGEVVDRSKTDDTDILAIF